MKKRNKKIILLLSTLSATLISSGVLLSSSNFSKPNELRNKDFNENKNIRFNSNDFDNTSKYNTTEKILKKNSFNMLESQNTNKSFTEQNVRHTTNFKIFKNKVNEKYLKYVKLNFEHKYNIFNAHTRYNGLESDKQEINSQIITFSDFDLTKRELNLNKQNSEININNIYYPFKYARQILGTIDAKTDGFKTILNFKKGANLPLSGNEYSMYVENGQVIDSDGNYSFINSNDISMKIINSNVGVVGNKEKTTLNDYQMIINKKVTGKLFLSLNPNSNNTDMYTSIDIVDNSPKVQSSSVTLNNESWTININGNNLPLETDKYKIRIDNSGDIENINIKGTSSNIILTFNHKIENLTTKPYILLYVKGEWQWKNISNFTNNTPPKKFIKSNTFLHNQLNKKMSTIDSQENPAGLGSYKYSTNIEKYETSINFDNSVDIHLVQHLRYGIKNELFDWARYNGESLANFGVENSIIATYPKLDSLFDYLTRKVANNSRWDNEFYYGEREMNQSNKNINELLFASNSEKEVLLTDFYYKVFNNVFNANRNTQGYKIGELGESAQELFIYEPANWRVRVKVKDDSCYIIFSYIYFDGQEKSFEYPFRTKLFLNNLDKQLDDYSKWDLRIIKKESNIDISQTNDEKLYYADVFYNLFDNYEGSKKLYESIISYRDQNNVDNSVKLVETLFTKKQFLENISRLNLINILKKDRMIYFTTTNEKGEQYNSWSDLAKGNLKFNIEIGNDFQKFYLKNNWTNINKYTYTFTNFKTQYDIYYNQIANQSDTNIQLQGFEDKNVETVTADWIIDNLIVFDNRSANSIENIRISSSSNEGDNKILATNLLKDDFIKLVLLNKNNINIIKRDKANGTFTIEITLPNLGDDPAIYKNRFLTSQNKTKYLLLTNQTNKKLTFNISGLQKYYDLQYNFEKSDMDAQKINIDNSIDEIENEINIQQQGSLEIFKKIISFDWYNESTRDPNFNNKLLKTRLKENEFFEKIKPIIEKNNHKGQNGINNFSGIYYANLVFSGTEEQRLNAIKYNFSESNPTTFEKVTNEKIPFSIFNLKRNMFFQLGNKFLVNSQSEYLQFSIDYLKQQIPSEIEKDIKNGNDGFINLLDNLNLIGYKKTQNDDSEVLFNTNALNKNDLINSIKDGIVKFENIISMNEKGILRFDLTIDPKGGKLNSNSNPITFKLELINLKKSASDFNDVANIKSITLDDFNKMCQTSYLYAQQVTKENVLDNLIHYSNSNNDILKEDNSFLFKTDLTKEEFRFALLDDNEGFQLNIQNYEQVIIGQMIFNKLIPINGILRNSISFKITGFKGMANTNWKISNNDILNVGNYNNNSIQYIDDFNDDFIYNNMISFKENVSKNINKILDNSYLTKEEFISQLNPKIDITKENDRVRISIVTNRVGTHFKNDKYNSINFYVNGFSSKGWFEKHKDKFFWTTIGVIATTILTFGTIGIIKKIKKKNN